MKTAAGSRCMALAGVALAGMAVGGGGAPLRAEALTAQEIADLTLVDVPLVLDTVDTAGRTEQLWASGDEPANTLIARLTLRPVGVAVAKVEAGSEMVLWRAFTGGGVTRLAASELPLDTAPFRYCGVTAKGRPPICLSDETGDGSFDRIAPAVAERGSKPYHVTLAQRFTALPTPIPYTVLAAGQRPAIEVRLRNCAKDYDRPRFSAQSTDDRGEPVFTGGLDWHAKDSSFAGCRRGRQIDAQPGQDTPPGGFLAQLGPLAVAVGPRKAPALDVLGPVDADALYRLEAATLVDLRVGPTPNQAEIVAQKKFPHPVLLADPGTTVERGVIAPGAVLARVPFHHAYRGRLLETVEIRTLLGKRALPAGTVLYGYPARRSVSMSVNGMPVSTAVDEDSFRKIDVALTWCTPVRGAPPKVQNPQEMGRGGWAAACIPQSRAGTYTILTDRQPALAIERLSYEVNTSSNPGSAPIERQDDARFDAPLRIDYVFQSHQGENITLRENIYFGDELTSSSPEAVYAPAGTGAVTIAGAPVTLTRNPDGTITAAPGGDPVIGGSARLEWDRRAFMLAQIRRLGLRSDDQPAPDAAGQTGTPAPK